jgi:hypothetical protein
MFFYSNIKIYLLATLELFKIDGHVMFCILQIMDKWIRAEG